MAYPWENSNMALTIHVVLKTHISRRLEKERIILSNDIIYGYLCLYLIFYIINHYRYFNVNETLFINHPNSLTLPSKNIITMKNQEMNANSSFYLLKSETSESRHRMGLLGLIQALWGQIEWLLWTSGIAKKGKNSTLVRMIPMNACNAVLVLPTTNLWHSITKQNTTFGI